MTATRPPTVTIAIVPIRNTGGHRLYSREQLEQLAFVKARMDEGVSAADAHRLLAERIEEGLPVAPPAAARSRLVILLAERDPYAAEFEEYFLKTEGFDVEVALSEGEARKAFDELSPSVVIVELLISGGAGLDLCRFVKRENGALIVAVSVLECRDLAVAAGADAFLLKPLDPLHLVSTVKDLLGSSALLRTEPQPAS